jgi:hypothetical protein
MTNFDQLGQFIIGIFGSTDLTVVAILVLFSFLLFALQVEMGGVLILTFFMLGALNLFFGGLATNLFLICGILVGLYLALMVFRELFRWG